ncbi:BrnT family toxin [Polynucleobacter sp. UK-Mo-2m-Kol15]|uniref:BrnT family toxin n=1 Tax=Polynucleobacter sp. UK-Mo-2m-Kol15 TaxID=2576916 RepID=UPI001C0DD334|nr:BrnT family toxin [Polynucleobacter sp. UK-Mo-2m-Kol15]
MYNVHITSLRFEWEPKKSSANLKKHGISFEEAKSVFYDEGAKLISDPDHSEDEDRFILLGVSHSLRVILVCHCYRSEDNVVRIISARKATPKESKAY